jgi:hypothetical protein
MISVCMIYSNGRLPQAVQVAKYISACPYTLDLIQVCDGDPDHKLPGYRQIVVKRHLRHFRRSDLWSGGIGEARFPRVIVIDCDRLPHAELFRRAATLEPRQVVYCTRLYQLLRPFKNPFIEAHLNGRPITSDFAKPDFRVVLEHGSIRPAKNPMSGCVALWRRDYFDVGGMSQEFVGWGFNDTDFYMKALFGGLKFIPLDLPEFHLHHGYEVPKRTLLAMNAWNAVRFYDRWGLEVHPELDTVFEALHTTQEFIRHIPLELFLDCNVKVWSNLW